MDRRSFALATVGALGLFACYLMPAISFAQGDFSIPSLAPAPSGKHATTEADKRLREAVVKEDARKNIQEAAELLALATDLSSEVARDGDQYVSARAAGETKRIEKLAKNIRARMTKDIRDIHF